MDVMVHIGDAKCGSTAIQRALWVSRSTLRDQGVLYHSARPPGQYDLVRLAGLSTRGDADAALRRGEQTVSELRDMIERDRPRLVVISAESLFGVAPEAVQSIIHRLGGEFEQIHVLGYARCPAAMYLSLTQQRLKADHHFVAPARYHRPLAGPFRSWLDEGRGEVEARPFDRSILIGGSVVQDFAAILGRWLGTPVTLPDEQANVTLSAEQMIVLQRFRSDFLADVRGFHPQSNAVLRLFEELNREGMIGTRPALTAAAAHAVHAGNKEELRRLSSLFPDAGFDRLCRRPPRAGPIGDPDAVSEILEGWSPNTVADLRMLLPGYTTALFEGEVRQPAEALRRLGVEVVRPYVEYLRSEDLDAAATAIDGTRL